MINAQIDESIGSSNEFNTQEQALLPVLTKVMDAAFRLGYYTFTDCARFVLEKIRAELDGEAADMITLDHLQGAYIGLAGKYQDQGASTKKEVIAIESLDELDNPKLPTSVTKKTLQEQHAESQPMQHANWISQAREHWREHQPKRFKQLKAQGILNQKLREAADATAQEMQTLVGQGFSQLEAWEMTREQYLFPPEEAGASEEAPVSEGLRLQRELNETLRYLGMTDEEIEVEKALGF